MSVLRPDELASVADALVGAGASVSGGLRARLLAGGRSNITALLEDGAGAGWVLRMPPRVGRTPSAHDVAREFRVVAALATAGVPVPPPVVLRTDDAVLGCDYAVTEFVPGAAVRSHDDMNALDPATVDAVVTDLVTSLAALHRVDHHKVGLGDFGRSSAYAERQLRRWSGQWPLVAGDASEEATRAATELVDRLTSSVPDQPTAAVIHGDYRIDNALLRLDGPRSRVAAIVDWELSTIGDPVADVAMMCAYRHPAFDDVLGFPAAWTSPALPAADDIAEAYLAAGGVELTSWRFHLALAHFKVAVIAAGISHRHRAAGEPASTDTAFRAVEPFLQAGLDLT